MLAKTHSAQVVGLNSYIIDIEVDLSRGLHSFSLVGLPDKAVEEAKERISAAIKNSGFQSPLKSNKRVIVSLAPADLKKEGPIFDLSIALTYLLATKEANFQPKNKLFLGELSLDGSLRPIKGALMIAQKARATGFEEIYLPEQNAKEAALVRGIKIYGCPDLKSIVLFLSPQIEEDAKQTKIELTIQPETVVNHKAARETPLDLADIKGQPTAKRGLEIAAAGGHNVAMVGPPGTGKTMLAKAFAGILPPLSFDEVLEVTGIHGAISKLEELVVAPPFRAPHHTASYVSLVGGGDWPRPGEITLAHRGVLFLDEFPEFEKRVIEALRQPLEDRLIRISRAKGSLNFPASFILIAAMNPCPCGNLGLRQKECVCTQSALLRYQRKLSGPIVDRIDLWIDVPQVEHRLLSEAQEGESSNAVRERVSLARERQTNRYQKHNLPPKNNSEMGVRELKKLAPLSETCIKLLNDSAKRLDLSARAYHRVIKLARTIADLEADETIGEGHLLEALQYRPRLRL